MTHYIILTDVFGSEIGRATFNADLPDKFLWSNRIQSSVIIWNIRIEKIPTDHPLYGEH